MTSPRSQRRKQRKTQRKLWSGILLLLAWTHPVFTPVESEEDTQYFQSLASAPTQLTATQLDGQRKIAQEYPEIMGNQDGISARVRDEANRIMIPRHKAELREQENRLRQELAHEWFHGKFTHTEDRLAEVHHKLEDLDVVEKTLGAHPEARLLMLDMTSKKRGQAAIAVGDPGTAEHISITVPGVNSSPELTLPGMVTEAENLKKLSEKIANAQGSHDTVATIAWMGYDAPQFSLLHAGQHSDPAEEMSWAEELKGALTVSNDARAQQGAKDLVHFCQGIVDAWQPHTVTARHSPDLTVLGHSYGSLVVSLALQQLPKNTATNVVFYGSPGINLSKDSTAEQLGVQAGHAFVLFAEDDPMMRLPNWLSGIAFGGRPENFPWLIRLSTHAGRGIGDGQMREQAHGHTDYPRANEQGELRMSGYNLATVIIGRSDLALRGS